MERWEGDLFGTPVTVDVDATRAWYAKGNRWACDCGHCRNFLLLAERRQLPEAILACLHRFGIRPEQATYVCELCPTEGGHRMQFSYRLAGWMDADHRGQGTIEGGEVACTHEAYPFGAPDFPTPHFDLECVTVFPWVLDEGTQD